MGDETELLLGMVLSVEFELYVPGYDAITFYPRDSDSLIVPV